MAPPSPVVVISTNITGFIALAFFTPTLSLSPAISAALLVSVLICTTLFCIKTAATNDDEEGRRKVVIRSRLVLTASVIALGVLTFTGLEGACPGNGVYQSTERKCYDYEYVPDDDDMTNVETGAIPGWITPNPPTQPDSCFWVTRKKSRITSTETTTQIFESTAFTGDEYPPDRGLAHLGGSVCGGDTNVDDFSALQSMIDLLPALSARKGILSSEWEKEKCQAYLANTLQNALYPVCGSDCNAIGVCENDCLKTLEYCGPVLDIDFAGSLLINGTYHEMVLGLLAKPDYKLCLEDILQHAIVKRCDASSIDSDTQIGSFAKPGEQCLAFNFSSGDSLLNEPSGGDCALSKWDDYSEQKVIDDAINLELQTANFTWRQRKYSTKELKIDDPKYKWGGIAFPLIVVLAIFNNIIPFTKGGSDKNGSVAPVENV